MAGIAAYILADIFHEVIGHCGGCLIAGQHIDLISSVYFISSPGSFITDISGPVANLIAGLLIFIFLNRWKINSSYYRFLLLLFMSYNLFWFSGTILQSSFSKTGDWTYFISQMDQGTFGNPILIIGGIAAYYFSIKLISVQISKFSSEFPEFPLKRSIYFPYFASALAAIIAGLFFSPDRMTAAKEGLLEVVGSIPLLFMKFERSPGNTGLKLGNVTTINLSICIVFILFCFTLGQGIFLK
ncbi:MAG TPA: hypothetical protein VKA26_11940 [Ignavibacteriaceae bacterium]|nr:hypothetical protein [Ignavibacteriaceae bacterium]